MAEQQAVEGTAAAGEDSGLSSEGYGWMPDLPDNAVPAPRPGLLARLRVWWGMRTLRLSPQGTAAIPVGQHEQLSEADKFRRDYGYSLAVTPEAATPEIEAHNFAIALEYNEEVNRRKAALKAGNYHPRYFVPQLSSVQRQALAAMVDDDSRALAAANMLQRRAEAVARGKARLEVDEVMWDLEMSQLPGRRANVTDDPGLPFVALSPSSVASREQADEIRTLRAKVTEREALGRERTVRDIIGDRESILIACGGNEQMADAVEANAKRSFNVASLDAVPARL